MIGDLMAQAERGGRAYVGKRLADGRWPVYRTTVEVFGIHDSLEEATEQAKRLSGDNPEAGAGDSHD